MISLSQYSYHTTSHPEEGARKREGITDSLSATRWGTDATKALEYIVYHCLRKDRAMILNLGSMDR